MTIEIETPPDNLEAIIDNNDGTVPHM